LEGSATDGEERGSAGMKVEDERGYKTKSAICTALFGSIWQPPRLAY